MSFDDKLDASLDLLRRLDPRQVADNLGDICALVSADSGEDGAELAQELLSSVDVPLTEMKCPDTGKTFLCCDYNRDGDLLRSPWSNKYTPAPEEDAPYPSDTLRQLEVKANDSFDVYRDLYYDGAGTSSAYFWDTGDDDGSSAGDLSAGFAGVVLFKKTTDDDRGKWDSVHVFEVIPELSLQAVYKLTTAVILDLQNQEKSSLSLSGTLTRQVETVQSLALDPGTSVETNHLINLGTLVEKTESNIRNLLQEVYFDKLKSVLLRDLRSVGDLADEKLDRSKQLELIKGLQGL